MKGTLAKPRHKSSPPPTLFSPSIPSQYSGLLPHAISRLANAIEQFASIVGLCVAVLKLSNFYLNFLETRDVNKNSTIYAFQGTLRHFLCGVCASARPNWPFK